MFTLELERVQLAAGLLLLLEIGEMVISAFIGLIGLGPASRVFTCSKRLAKFW